MLFRSVVLHVCGCEDVLESRLAATAERAVGVSSQQLRERLSMTAQVVYADMSIWTAPETSGTATGEAESAVVPLPSWPNVLLPQRPIVPSTITAHDGWSWP